MRKIKKATSIYDVARLAKVSPSTVSRFLNRTTFVSDDKSKKIERAIKSLGYKPNYQTNQGNHPRSMTIGVLIQNPESPFTSRVLNDMEKVLNAQGYSLVIATGHWQKALESQALECLAKSNVDGVIIVTGTLSEEQILEYAKRIPVVAVGYDFTGENVHTINVDNVLGGYMAALHLMQQGHVNIAHVKGLINHPDAIARFTGYKKALQEAGIKVQPKLIKQGDFSSESGYKRTVELIESKVHFSSLFAANDQMAFGAIKALHDHNFRVPEDVSVIGFDDLPISQYFTPALTTMRLPIEEIGAVCAEAIMNLLSGEKHAVRLPPIDLIIRQSTLSKFRTDASRKLFSLN